jgi:Tfp pilus assembly protein PilF
MSGKEQEGVQMAHRALEIDLNNGDAHVTLAKYYGADKNHKLAKMHFAKAKALGAQPDLRLIDK